MEKPPKNRADTFWKETYESSVGKFEIVEIEAITGKNVETGDRAFIYTESGNRYMLRRSKSNNDSLMVYNEREGKFAPESGRVLGVQKESQYLAEVGQPFHAFAIGSVEAMTGQEFKSTLVKRIQIIRGIDADYCACSSGA